MTKPMDRPVAYDFGGYDISTGEARFLPCVDQNGDFITVHMGPLIKHLRAEVAKARIRGIQDALAEADAYHESRVGKAGFYRNIDSAIANRMRISADAAETLIDRIRRLESERRREEDHWMSPK